MDSRPQPVGSGHAETAPGSRENNMSYLPKAEVGEAELDKSAHYMRMYPYSVP